MITEPLPEHQWLQRLVGEWESVAEWSSMPGEQRTGTETVRSLGGLWVVAESEGSTPCGGPATMMISLGVDPTTRRYVGTWIGSMMANLWVYDGELSADDTTLTLAAEGPDMFAEGKTGLYHDVIQFQDEDHRTLTARVQREDGTWYDFMTIHYQRTR